MRRTSIGGAIFDLFMKGIFLFLGLCLTLSWGFHEHVWP